MTDDQLFDLLDELGIVRVSKPEGSRIMLVCARGEDQETLSASDLKTRSLSSIRGLEEKRQEVSENRFAEPLNGELSLGETHAAVHFLKKDDQLTESEMLEKRRLLEEIDAEIGYHRVIVAGMNHLQVNFKELALRLIAREGSGKEQAEAPRLLPGKLRWTKGVKSAALHCLKESRRPENAEKSELDICREFLTTYILEEDEEYTPHHLFLNIQQIKLLDQAD